MSLLTGSATVSESDLVGKFQERPRLGLAREYFLGERGLDDLSELSRWFDGWVDRTEFLLLKKIEGAEKSYVAVKCSKRGNDVYQSRVEMRLRRLESFARTERSKGRNQVSNVLAVTLTWAGATSVREAWERITPEWNRWITGIRRRFGRVVAFRVLESTQRGYPHIHALLFFREFTFSCFRHVSASGRVSYRTQAKSYFERGWDSFVDVEVATSTQHMIGYFKKYMTKGHGKSGQEEINGQTVNLDTLTLALNWLFRKRSFAVSKELATVLSDLIASLRNSNGQTDLAGQFIRVWKAIGVFFPGELKIVGDGWEYQVDPDVGYAAECARLGKLAADSNSQFPS